LWFLPRIELGGHHEPKVAGYYGGTPAYVTLTSCALAHEPAAGGCRQHFQVKADIKSIILTPPDHIDSVTGASIRARWRKEEFGQANFDANHFPCPHMNNG